jgi:4-coumarate--CoA ligase
MPWKSRWHIDIPTVSLPTYLFGGQDATLDRKPIILDAEQPSYSLSLHDYREWSKRFAAGLKAQGFQEGDRLLLYSGNTIFFPVVLIGTIMAGGIFSGANPTYVARELAYQLQDTGAKFLITAEGSLDTALEAAKSIGFPRDKILSFDGGYDTFDGKGKPTQDIQHWSSLLASPSEGSRFRWQEFTSATQMDDTVVLNYSSGTTGVPKGVEITHLNYVSNCMQTDYVSTLDPDHEAVNARMRGLSMLPMYHAYGQTTHCVSAPRKGIPIYVMQKFDFGKMLKCIQEYRITGLTLVPPIVVALAKRPEARKFDLSSVEVAGCGAAPLGREPQTEFESLWPAGQVNLKQGWGMTEITCSACGMEPTAIAVDATVGELNPNIEAMIVDEEKKEVAIGERGEFWVKGPNVMKGYWRKPDATKETMTEDGWLKTGDIAFRNKEGFIYIVDRKKVSRAMLCVRSFNVTDKRHYRNSSRSRATRSPQQSWRVYSSITQLSRMLLSLVLRSMERNYHAHISLCKMRRP